MSEEKSGMWAELKQVFKDDCVEVRGYTKNEAEKLWRDHGEDFVESMIDDMWTNWSENFPIDNKDEEEE